MKNYSNKEKRSEKQPVMGIEIDEKTNEIIGDDDEARKIYLDYLLLSQS